MLNCLKNITIICFCFLSLILLFISPCLFLQIFVERFRHVSRFALPNSELKKVDGGLTCRALLVPKTPKILK